jgi:hypothetical protein
MAHEHKKRVLALLKKMNVFIDRTSGVLLHPGSSTTLTKRNNSRVKGSSSEFGMTGNTRRIFCPINYS